MRDLDEAIAIDAACANEYNNRSTIWALKGDAMKALTEAIRLEPENPATTRIAPKRITITAMPNRPKSIGST